MGCDTDGGARTRAANVNPSALDPTRFAELAGAERVWAVGVIHAHADALRALHDSLASRFRRGDRLVYLGNYYGAGPDAIATVDELLLFRREFLARPGVEPWDIVFLRGAQEEMWSKLLQIQFAPNPNDVLDWMLSQGLGAVVEAYGSHGDAARGAFREGALAVTRWTSSLRGAVHAHPGHDELMDALRRGAYTAADGLLFVHAGVDPARPLTDQGDTLWWGSGHFDDIAAPYDGFRKVIRGYDRMHRGVVDDTFTATVDGGCGHGGKLTAGCFERSGTASEWVEA